VLFFDHLSVLKPQMHWVVKLCVKRLKTVDFSTSLLTYMFGDEVFCYGRPME